MARMDTTPAPAGRVLPLGWPPQAALMHPTDEHLPPFFAAAALAAPDGELRHGSRPVRAFSRERRGR
jgi:hypothetical protein